MSLNKQIKPEPSAHIANEATETVSKAELNELRACKRKLEEMELEFQANKRRLEKAEAELKKDKQKEHFGMPLNKEIKQEPSASAPNKNTEMVDKAKIAELRACKHKLEEIEPQFQSNKCRLEEAETEKQKDKQKEHFGMSLNKEIKQEPSDSAPAESPEMVPREEFNRLKRKLEETEPELRDCKRKMEEMAAEMQVEKQKLAELTEIVTQMRVDQVVFSSLQEIRPILPNQATGPILPLPGTFPSNQGPRPVLPTFTSQQGTRPPISHANHNARKTRRGVASGKRRRERRAAQQLAAAGEEQQQQNSEENGSNE